MGGEFGRVGGHEQHKWLGTQQPEWATPQITVTARDCRRHRDPLDYQHPYDSMRRYPELLALKYQKMKGNEP
jgi:hypothetical protein